MTAFASLSAVARAFTALFALLLILLCVCCTALAARRRRYLSVLASLFLCAPVYLLWQVIFDLSLREKTGSVSALSAFFGELPAVVAPAILLALAVPAVLLLIRNLRADRTSVTPGAIKVFLDRTPCGVCCYRDNGRVLFSNVCMKELCTALTGEPLLNGATFAQAVKDGIIEVGGRVWRFTCREIFPDGERLHEIVSSDITTEYRKTQALEKDRAELSALNGQLEEYYHSIDDTVRRREILQAKMNIHDEMNRLMLGTVSAGSGDRAELDRIFSLWEKNALLLCKEAGEKQGSDAEEAEGLGKALKIAVLWREELPTGLSEEQKDLFFKVLREAMVNAVKHARAKTLTVCFEEDETLIRCLFTNDGAPAREGIAFTGGLRNLAQLAAGQGAGLFFGPGQPFALILRFPKK